MKDPDLNQGVARDQVEEDHGAIENKQDHHKDQNPDLWLDKSHSQTFFWQGSKKSIGDLQLIVNLTDTVIQFNLKKMICALDLKRSHLPTKMIACDLHQGVKQLVRIQGTDFLGREVRARVKEAVEEVNLQQNKTIAQADVATLD